MWRIQNEEYLHFFSFIDEHVQTSYAEDCAISVSILHTFSQLSDSFPLTHRKIVVYLHIHLTYNDYSVYFSKVTWSNDDWLICHRTLSQIRNYGYTTLSATSCVRLPILSDLRLLSFAISYFIIKF